MASHKIWVEAGRPRSGPIYLKRTHDKFSYKSLINDYKNRSKVSSSNELNDLLLSKNSNTFWRTWKNKVCGTSNRLPCIDGSYDETINANKFKKYFASACSANSAEFNANADRELQLKLNSLMNMDHDNTEILFNAELVALAAAKLHTGKTPGIDKLQTEHLLNSHPMIYNILAKLFHFFMKCKHVPGAFGRGIMIPIPKESGHKGIMSVDQFRGITVSPVISKLLEHCLLMIFKHILWSSERQLGYKNKSSCMHAIFMVRKVVDYFVQNGSTMNICCLDISKAFDRVNCNQLFLKLLSRGAPPNLVLMLQNWYSNSFCCVKWGNITSDFFQITCGVRQGGVLSGSLFNIYVNDILDKLDKHGSKMFGLCFGSFMYCDDLILLSPSVEELQTMVNICCMELSNIDLRLNVAKSKCIRIGRRWHIESVAIETAYGSIHWSTEVRYLGVNIIAGSKFQCNIDDAKRNFYASFNAIYSKLGKINNPIVTLKLISTIALPCLLFAQEALPMTKSYTKALEHPWSRAFMKIFCTFNELIVRQCQYYTGHLPIEHLVQLRKFNFFDSFKGNSNWLLASLFDLLVFEELGMIFQKYGIPNIVDVSYDVMKKLIDNKFSALLDLGS
jgi:hypothetical protein